MRIVSGIQPSGFMHVGNYLGALRRWVRLQQDDNNECFFFIADLHALTIPKNPNELRDRVFDTMRAMLSVGLDPSRSALYAHSAIPAHAELQWIFETLTPLSLLKDMHQFKDKSAKQGKDVNAGLFSYPVLQAADVLLYDGELVPVGEDQRQHIELMRDIARKFNNRFGQTFVEPKFYEGEQPIKIMGLQHPQAKMSKSDDGELNTIGIFDEPDRIRKNISKSVTDSYGEVRLDWENKPGVSNLLTIFSMLADRSIDDLHDTYNGKNYGEFKNDLAELAIETFAPMREMFEKLEGEADHVREQFTQGAEHASRIASKKITDVKSRVGL